MIRVLLLQPAVTAPAPKSPLYSRSIDLIREEACGLVRSLENAYLAEVKTRSLRRIDPKTFFTKGFVENIALEMGEAAASSGADQETEEDQGITKTPRAAIDLIVVNAALSPLQQKNLEKIWARRVLDRTALILELFSQRARTKEGALQVELAMLSYQRARLVRTWTHLERQRGGLSFIGGAGESQLELDRRLLDTRIRRLKDDVARIRQNRKTQRKQRQRAQIPVVALIGYTNAGKTTLFHSLTRQSAQGEDRLFATLDPSLRRVRYKQRDICLLSDTVGFISDLPHELVAAFHATLEEILEADLIVHIQDGACEDFEAQRLDVLNVLREIGWQKAQPPIPLIEVINKADLMTPDHMKSLAAGADGGDGAPLFISAVQSTGIEALLERIQKKLEGDLRQRTVHIPSANGKVLSWLEEHSQILERRYDEKQKIFGIMIHITDKKSTQLDRLLDDFSIPHP